MANYQGNKYRVVNPGKHLKKELQKYLKSYLPKYYLTEGLTGHNYTGSSIAKIVGTNALEAGIKKRVSPQLRCDTNNLSLLACSS